jgi:hypothetical protein
LKETSLTCLILPTSSTLGFDNLLKYTSRLCGTQSGIAGGQKEKTQKTQKTQQQ